MGRLGGVVSRLRGRVEVEVVVMRLDIEGYTCKWRGCGRRPAIARAYGLRECVTLSVMPL